MNILGSTAALTSRPFPLQRDFTNPSLPAGGPGGPNTSNNIPNMMGFNGTIWLRSFTFFSYLPCLLYRSPPPSFLSFLSCYLTEMGGFNGMNFMPYGDMVSVLSLSSFDTWLTIIPKQGMNMVAGKSIRFVPIFSPSYLPLLVRIWILFVPLHFHPSVHISFCFACFCFDSS